MPIPIKKGGWESKPSPAVPPIKKADKYPANLNKGKTSASTDNRPLKENPKPCAYDVQK